MKIQFKRLNPYATIPTKAYRTDAGYDLTAIRTKNDGNQITYDTGLAINIPEGYVGLLFPRSSVYKHSLSLSNCVGVLDAGYQDSIKFIFNIRMSSLYNNNPRPTVYEVGSRIGQLVVIKLEDTQLEEVNEFSPSSRGTNGFGSSGA